MTVDLKPSGPSQLLSLSLLDSSLPKRYVPLTVVLLRPTSTTRNPRGKLEVVGKITAREDSKGSQKKRKTITSRGVTVGNLTYTSRSWV